MSDRIDVGIDIVPISEVEDLISGYGEFLTRVFTEKEMACCPGKKRSGEHLAARFAAKEAVLKAFGLGLGKGIEWTDVETLSTNSGRPTIRLHGRLKKIASRRRVGAVKVSLSHCKQYAVAQALVQYPEH